MKRGKGEAGQVHSDPGGLSGAHRIFCRSCVCFSIRVRGVSYWASVGDAADHVSRMEFYSPGKPLENPWKYVWIDQVSLLEALKRFFHTKLFNIVKFLCIIVFMNGLNVSLNT